MSKEEATKPLDKEDVSKSIDTIVSYMYAIDSSREAINEIVKRLKSDYGLAPSDVRAAATALKKQNVDEIDEKARRIQELIDLCL